MISTTSQAVTTSGLEHLDLLDVWAGCTRQTCDLKIKSIEQKLSSIAAGSSVFSACQSRLRHAKRFLQSDEYGGCDYELKIIELLMSEA